MCAEFDSPEYKDEMQKMISMRTSMIKCLLFYYLDTAKESVSAKMIYASPVCRSYPIGNFQEKLGSPGVYE